MPAVALFGLFLVANSLVMIVRPALWSEMGLAYVRFKYMHPMEIALCLGFGVLFVVFAGDSRFPAVVRVAGWVLVAVGAGLVLTPPSLHRRFGIWSIETFEGFFRPAAFGSLLLGIFLVYAAL